MVTKYLFYCQRIQKLDGQVSEHLLFHRHFSMSTKFQGRLLVFQASFCGGVANARVWCGLRETHGSKGLSRRILRLSSSDKPLLMSCFFFFNHKMLVGFYNPREKSYRMLDTIRIDLETHPIVYSASSSSLKDFEAGAALWF